MSNIVCKCAVVIVALILGVAAGLLNAYGMFSGELFVLPFVAVFAGIILLSLPILFIKTACMPCPKLIPAVCANGTFIGVSSFGALLSSLFAIALIAVGSVPVVAIAVVVGIAIFFATLLFGSIVAFVSSIFIRECNRCTPCE